MKITVDMIVFLALIISVISFRFVISLKEKRAFVKSIRRSNGFLIFISLIFFFIAYKYFRGFLNYRATIEDVKNGSAYLMNTFLWLSIGVFWILRALDRDHINEKGISTQEGSFVWDRIEDCKWGSKQSKDKRKGVLRYYNLTFTTKATKGKFKFLGGKSRKIVIQIDAKDRKRTEAYIKEKLAK